MFIQEAQESPGALDKEEHEYYRYQKGNRAASATTDEVFHEAMRSYEKALKSGIQLQEESVNLWKDLLTKLGSPKSSRRSSSR